MCVPEVVVAAGPWRVRPGDRNDGSNHQEDSGARLTMEEVDEWSDEFRWSGTHRRLRCGHGSRVSHLRVEELQAGTVSTVSHTPQVTVSETGTGTLTNDVTLGRHRFQSDEPTHLGGDDHGPNPYDLLCAALGSCTSMTLRMYAERKSWPLGQISVDVDHKRIGGEDVFTRRISLLGDLDDAQQARLVEIAGRCPVHRTLERSATIHTEPA